jgi:RNA polymerase sigma-54 factor
MANQYLAQTQQQRLQMVLAPQLRQSLELLQVPMLELQTLIQQELQQNPTIEQQLEAKEPLEIEPGGQTEQEELKELDFKEEFEVLARLDDEWREYFQQDQVRRPHSRDDESRREFFLNSLSQTQSLQEHLQGQLSMSGLDDEQARLGEMLIGSINDDGYLTTPIEEMAASTGHSLVEIEEILKIIQEFDPIGVGARDLKECLLLQLDRLGKRHSPVATLVEDHLDDLGAKRFSEICRSMKISSSELQQLATIVATLEPRPGRRFSSETANYVLPEITIKKVNGEYVVILNDENMPHLRISRHYRELMRNPATTKEVKSYIRDKIRAGAFLIKSINQRQQTIYRIASEIVRIQTDFLDNGIRYLKPLTMAEIAEIIGVHETTVSRAIANKYMQTPRGVFELKYFFTPGYKTDEGQSISNKTIKDAILQLVANEPSSKPLSDQAIVRELKEQGIKVARRTIAKYRDELRILPSHLRKSL